MSNRAALAAAATPPDSREMYEREARWARYLILETQHGHGTSVPLCSGKKPCEKLETFLP
jgi:hypothetical protein